MTRSRRAERDAARGLTEDDAAGALGEPDGASTLSLATRMPSATVRSLFADPTALANEARVIPHRGPDGEVDGFRVSALRTGQLGDLLGFQNGDVFHAVNDQPLASMEQALVAYTALSRADATELRFTVTRRGDPVTVTVPLDQPLSAFAVDAPSPEPPEGE